MDFYNKHKQTIQLLYEIILVLLAILSVVLIWVNNSSYVFLNQIVWFILFLDVAIRFIRTKNKWHFVKTNPFDLIAAIPLDALFQTARFARLFKFVRVFVLSKNSKHPIFGILKTNGLDKVLSASVVLIIVSAFIVSIVEPNVRDFSDGVWWSIVTTTTVGYGDISPETIFGRVLAIILMLVGIGLIGMLTGSITTFFVRNKPQQRASVLFIQEQLERVDQLSSQEIGEMIVLLEQLRQEKDE
ncbi:voltage-gated potassium channel [Natronobacillus azotifigens]|uniref:Ion channel n=1 Tax=Natronobacillus azotifigens TaxID=472978 RepID=A0A9J6R8Q7_9BACI|nr:potassium channel family protein [Natronobacillus azotifigens]MCZ0702042.1 ion channel [Natronobacillus azotifigens]